MATTTKRFTWACPLCGTRYNIPVGNDPERCPKCIDTTSRPARRRKSNGLLVVFGLAAASAAVALGVWIAMTSGSGDSIIPRVLIPKALDSERNAVHKWIDENANDGDWEEVRWWPAKVLTENRNKRIEGQKLFLDEARKWPPGKQEWNKVDIEIAEERLATLLKSDPLTACRIKWREKGPVGGPVLHDDMFVIEDGKARLYYASERRLWVWHEFKEYFPD